MDDPKQTDNPMRLRIVEAPNRPIAAGRPDPRHRTSGSARFASAVRRWARDTFSRDSLMSSLRSLMWVAPLTVLIWIYAEREQVAKVTLPPFPVEVKSADPRKVVTVLNPPDGLITADVNGPRARIEAVRDALDPRVNPAPLRVEVPADLAPGRHPIDAIGIARDSRLEGSGVSVTTTTPRVLDVLVQELAEDEAAVDVPPEVKDRLVAPPAFSPAKVRVAAPREVLEAARKDGPLVAYARLDHLLDTPGAHNDVPVQVDVPFAGRSPHVTVAPSTVRASATIKNATEVRRVLRGVVVWPIGAPAVLKEFEVQVSPDTLATVTVVGPEEQIRLLDAQVPLAAVRVGREDAGEESRRKPVEAILGLPDRVRVAPEDQKRQVEVKLVKKAAE
jgi:hypothetical protein